MIATATFAVLALAASLFFSNPLAGLLLLAALGSASVSVVLFRAQILGSRERQALGRSAASAGSN